MPIDRHTSEDEFDRNEDIRVDDYALSQTGRSKANRSKANRSKDSRSKDSRSKASKSRKMTSAAATATDNTDQTPASKAPASKVSAKERPARKVAPKKARKTARNRPGRTARSKEAALKELAQRQLVANGAVNLSADKASPDKASPDKASPDKASPDKVSAGKVSADKASERADRKAQEAMRASRHAGRPVGHGLGQGIIWSLLAVGLAACGGGTNTIRVAGKPETVTVAKDGDDKITRVVEPSGETSPSDSTGGRTPFGSRDDVAFVGDGPVIGAEVWVDENDDGVIDPGVDTRLGLTNGKGLVDIPVEHRGKSLMARGGTDVTTGREMPEGWLLPIAKGETVMTTLSNAIRRAMDAGARTENPDDDLTAQEVLNLLYEEKVGSGEISQAEVPTPEDVAEALNYYRTAGASDSLTVRQRKLVTDMATWLNESLRELISRETTGTDAEKAQTVLTRWANELLKAEEARVKHQKALEEHSRKLEEHRQEIAEAQKNGEPVPATPAPPEALQPFDAEEELSKDGGGASRKTEIDTATETARQAAVNFDKGMPTAVPMEGRPSKSMNEDSLPDEDTGLIGAVKTENKPDSDTKADRTKEPLKFYLTDQPDIDGVQNDFGFHAAGRGDTLKSIIFTDLSGLNGTLFYLDAGTGARVNVVVNTGIDVSDVKDGIIYYEPNANEFSAPDAPFSFTYRLSRETVENTNDALHRSEEVTMTFTVDAVNDRPTDIALDGISEARPDISGHAALVMSHHGSIQIYNKHGNIVSHEAYLGDIRVKGVDGHLRDPAAKPVLAGNELGWFEVRGAPGKWELWLKGEVELNFESLPAESQFTRLGTVWRNLAIAFQGSDASGPQPGRYMLALGNRFDPKMSITHDGTKKTITIRVNEPDADAPHPNLTFHYSPFDQALYDKGATTRGVSPDMSQTEKTFRLSFEGQEITYSHPVKTRQTFDLGRKTQDLTDIEGQLVRFTSFEALPSGEFRLTYETPDDFTGYARLSPNHRTTLEHIVISLSDGRGGVVNQMELFQVMGRNDPPSATDHKAAVAGVHGRVLIFTPDMFPAPDPDIVPGTGKAEQWTHIRFAESPWLANLTLNGQSVTAGQQITFADIRDGALQFKVSMATLKKMVSTKTTAGSLKEGLFGLKWQAQDAGGRDSGSSSPLENTSGSNVWSNEATLTVEVQQLAGPPRIRNFVSAEKDPVAFFTNVFDDPQAASNNGWQVTHIRLDTGARPADRAALDRDHRLGINYRDFDLANQGDIDTLTDRLASGEGLRFWVSVDDGATWSRSVIAAADDRKFMTYLKRQYDVRPSGTDDKSVTDFLADQKAVTGFFAIDLSHTGRDIRAPFEVFWNYDKAVNLYGATPLLPPQTSAPIFTQMGDFVGDDRKDVIIFTSQYGEIHGIDGPSVRPGTGIYLILDGRAFIGSNSFQGKPPVSGIASLSGGSSKAMLQGGERSDTFTLTPRVYSKIDSSWIYDFDITDDDAVWIQGIPSGRIGISHERTHPDHPDVNAVIYDIPSKAAHAKSYVFTKLHRVDVPMVVEEKKVTHSDGSQDAGALIRAVAFTNGSDASAQQLRGGPRADDFRIDAQPSDRAGADLIRYFNEQGRDSVSIHLPRSATAEDVANFAIDMVFHYTDHDGDGRRDMVISHREVGQNVDEAVENSVLAIILNADPLRFTARADPDAKLIHIVSEWSVPPSPDPGRALKGNKQDGTAGWDIFTADGTADALADTQKFHKFGGSGHDLIDVSKVPGLHNVPGGPAKQLQFSWRDVDGDGNDDTIVHKLNTDPDVAALFVLMDYDERLTADDFYGAGLDIT